MQKRRTLQNALFPSPTLPQDSLSVLQSHRLSVRGTIRIGKPFTGLQCKACGYITINTNALRKHCKKDHQQAWTGDKSLLYNTLSVQTFFRSGALQKYFRVR
jgi:hypothetical protein